MECKNYTSLFIVFYLQFSRHRKQNKNKKKQKQKIQKQKKFNIRRHRSHEVNFEVTYEDHQNCSKYVL